MPRALTRSRSPALDAGSGLPARRGQAGWSLLEMLIITLITAEVILAALWLFDFHNKLARVQGQVSDMQQSLRVAQYEMVRLVREAGRGGMPAVLQAPVPPAGGAIAVRNNVGGSVPDVIAIGNSGSPKIVDGTDVLTVRGVFSTPVYQINPLKTLTINASSGTLVVCAKTPTRVLQDLTPLWTVVANAAKAEQVEALILVSPLDEKIYAVVELDTSNSKLADQPQCPPAPSPNGALIAFKINGDPNANAFQQLGAVSGTLGLPPRMVSVTSLGVLEEYRYYVREDYAVPGNNKSDLTPHLSRARMYPGTETPYYSDPTNLQVDIADNVADLQIALGVDLDNDTLITEGSPSANPPDQTPSTTDDWIYNVANDPTFPGGTGAARLLEVRISTLAKTGNRDFQYQGPKLVNIEDHVYQPTDFINTPPGRAYRHRLLTTVVGLRNL